MDTKKLLVLGLGMTGQSAIKHLSKDAYQIYAYDDNDSFKENLPEYVEWYEDQELDLVLKSPGIPMDNKLVQQLKEKEILIISDIELAYRMTKSAHIAAITGTNGKTTCAILLNKVLENAGLTSHLTGNVGIPILDTALEATKDDYLVIECSSFQLESTYLFKPNIAIITNITEDHLDHHAGIENYRESKLNICRNQTKEDTLILNIDDPYLCSLAEGLDQAYMVSINPIEEKGAYLSEGKLWYNLGEGPIEFMDVDDLYVIGEHNYINLLQVLVAALIIGVDPGSVRETFSAFKGVEHRMEFLLNHDGILVYNDSKGTNPQSTEVALMSLDAPVHLIAGGFDKGSDFQELFNKTGDKIDSIYAIGETKDKIVEEASVAGIKNIFEFKSLKEATELAMDRAKPGEIILLSPACASWGMYRNFEERGDEFKEIILNRWGDLVGREDKEEE